MSINWVMLSPTSPTTFTPLANETTLYTSPPRTTLSLSSLNKFPGAQPFVLSSSAGLLHLTNKRIVYLPSTRTDALQSFAAPILNLHDSHVTVPWMGPNVWTAVVQPVTGGGIPPTHAALELKISFKEGGAYDFQSRFETVKERLKQAVEVARNAGAVTGDGSEVGRGRGGGALDGVDMGNVHLDELPRYEEAGRDTRVNPAVAAATRAPVEVPSPPPASTVRQEAQRSAPTTNPTSPLHVAEPPSEPPPSYEMAQTEVIEDELQRRLSAPRNEQ